jgi:hypothetical protein
LQKAECVLARKRKSEKRRRRTQILRQGALKPYELYVGQSRKLRRNKKRHIHQTRKNSNIRAAKVSFSPFRQL